MAHVPNTVHPSTGSVRSGDGDPAGSAIRGAGMSTAQRARWQRIEAFEIGDATWPLSFTRRLARDNAWSESFAVRVVAEYRRFVFLMVEAGHPVTPSDEVDQAWHLHMVYTRSYWDEMCGELLGRPLHHGPTKGGREEGAKFEDWYGRTLASYRRLFGEAPPTDIWPDGSTRFGRAPHFARVNLRENWVIPKPRVRPASAAGAAMLTLAAGLAGCGVVLAQGGTGTTASASGTVTLLLILGAVAIGLCVIGAIVVLARAASSTPLDRRKRRDGSSGCSSLTYMGGTTGCAGTSKGHPGGDHNDGSPSSGTGCGGTSGCGGGSASGSSGCSSSGCGGGGCGGGGD